jgi:hypothetical protein
VDYKWQGRSVRPAKLIGAHIRTPHNPNADYAAAIVCPVGFLPCFGPMLPFCNGNVYSVTLYLGNMYHFYFMGNCSEEFALSL